MKTLLAIILSFLLSDFSGGQTAEPAHYGSAWDAHNALYDLLNLDSCDERTYPYNFGGVVTEEKGEKTIYTIRITNNDTSPYKDVIAAYDGVRFEQVEYSMTELEVIGSLFIAAHPEIAEYSSVSAYLNWNMAEVCIEREIFDEYERLKADAEGLPIVVLKSSHVAIGIVEE